MIFHTAFHRVNSLSIFWKLALPTAILVLLSGGITAAIVYYRTVSVLDEEMHDRVMTRSMQLAANAEFLLGSSDPDALDQLHDILPLP